MSKEQEDAAKWAVVEGHQKATARIAALRVRLSGWGRVLSETGEALQHNPEGLEVPSDGLPSATEINAAISDLKTTLLEFGQYAERMRELGLGSLQ